MLIDEYTIDENTSGDVKSGSSLDQTKAMKIWLGLDDVVVVDRGDLAPALRRRARG